MSKTERTRVYVFTLKVKKARLVTVLRFKHQWLAYMAIKHLKKRFLFDKDWLLRNTQKSHQQKATEKIYKWVKNNRMKCKPIL